MWITKTTKQTKMRVIKLMFVEYGVRGLIREDMRKELVD